MYKALEFFTDLQDNNFAYKIGDVYPREGYTPSAERIAELVSCDNKRGNPVIGLIDNDENSPEIESLELLGDEHIPEAEKTVKTASKGRKATKKTK